MQNMHKRERDRSPYIMIFPPVGGMKSKLCVYFLPEIALKLTRLNKHITLVDHATLYMQDFCISTLN